MAYYDSKQNRVISWPSIKCKNYPEWEEIDCGCCAGLEWGGEYPIECARCAGAGVLFCHKKSGVLAAYPGGPFRGKL